MRHNVQTVSADSFDDAGGMSEKRLRSVDQLVCEFMSFLNCNDPISRGCPWSREKCLETDFHVNLALASQLEPFRPIEINRSI